MFDLLLLLPRSIRIALAYSLMYFSIAKILLQLSWASLLAFLQAYLVLYPAALFDPKRPKSITPRLLAFIAWKSWYDITIPIWRDRLQKNRQALAILSIIIDR